MKSFVFWLATAGSLGAVAGTMLRPGLVEILIVWIAIIALHYGWRNVYSRRNASPSV